MNTLQITLHAIFAFVFGGMAYLAIPRGWTFLKIGWAAIDAHASQPDRDTNIERQRGISDGTRFFLAGAAWLTAGIAAALIAVVIAYLGLRYL